MAANVWDKVNTCTYNTNWIPISGLLKKARTAERRHREERSDVAISM